MLRSLYRRMLYRRNESVEELEGQVLLDYVLVTPDTPHSSKLYVESISIWLYAVYNLELEIKLHTTLHASILTPLQGLGSLSTRVVRGALFALGAMSL